MKRISVHLPQPVLNELDTVANQERRSRGEIVRRAIVHWLQERQQRHCVESMKRGYLEMAGINLKIASEAFHAEEDADDTLGRLVSGG